MDESNLRRASHGKARKCSSPVPQQLFHKCRKCLIEEADPRWSASLEVRRKVEAMRRAEHSQRASVHLLSYSYQVKVPPGPQEVTQGNRVVGRDCTAQSGRGGFLVLLLRENRFPVQTRGSLRYFFSFFLVLSACHITSMCRVHHISYFDATIARVMLRHARLLRR